MCTKKARPYVAHAAPGVCPQDLICARRELEQLQEEFLGLLESSAESRVQVKLITLSLLQ